MRLKFFDPYFQHHVRLLLVRVVRSELRIYCQTGKVYPFSTLNAMALLNFLRGPSILAGCQNLDSGKLVMRTEYRNAAISVLLSKIALNGVILSVHLGHFFIYIIDLSVRSHPRHAAKQTHAPSIVRTVRTIRACMCAGYIFHALRLCFLISRIQIRPFSYLQSIMFAAMHSQ